jgi:lipopolysaccharide transport system ATP-binding protein
MGAVAGLCSRALLLDHGRLELDGPTGPVIGRYLSTAASRDGRVAWPGGGAAPGNDRVRLVAVGIESGGVVTGDVEIDREIRVLIDFENLAPGLHLSTSIHLLDKVGVEVLATANLPSANLVQDEWFGRAFPAGRFRAMCVIPGNFLNDGAYSIRVALCSDVSRIEFVTEEIIGFVVHDSGEMRKEYTGHWLGVVRPRLAWHTAPLDPVPPSSVSPSQP